MRKTIGRGLLPLLLLCFVPVAQADETLSLKVGYQVLSPSGDLAAEVNGFGTRIDIESDLGVGDSEEMIAEAALALGDFKITAGYMPLSFAGTTTISRPLFFDGKLYTAGSSVASSVDLDILDLGGTWYFLNLDDSPARLQLGLEVAFKITDAEASLVDLSRQETKSASATVPIPTVGMRGRLALADFVGINGRVGYLGYSDNHFLDADIQVEVSPLPLVGVFAGYRFLDIAIDESDIYVDSEFSGFYGGALIRF